MELRLERRDVRDFVRQSVSLFEMESGKHHIMLSLPDEPLVVECDPSRMSQLTSSLVSKAMEHSPAGGVVDVRVSREDGAAKIDVTDHGGGIPPREVERTFLPFQRQCGPRGVRAGAGVELSVARRVVEAHGGRIELESKLGEGSTFHVRLPLANAADGAGRAGDAGGVNR
jgi:signal transduction histidine kinase